MIQSAFPLQNYFQDEFIYKRIAALFPSLPLLEKCSYLDFLIRIFPLNHRIHFQCGKMQNRRSPITYIFYAVHYRKYSNLVRTKK